MVIRLGRNGRFLACSLFPSTRSRPLPGEESPPLPGEGETCPPCGSRGPWWPNAVGSGRSSDARATPSATSSRRTAPRPPPSSVSRSSARSTGTGTSSRVAPGGRGTSSGGARPIRDAISRRTSSRSAPSTTPTVARWPGTARPALPALRSNGAASGGEVVLVALALAGGPPEPGRPGPSDPRPAWALGLRRFLLGAQDRGPSLHGDDEAPRPGTRPRRVTDDPALGRFLRASRRATRRPIRSEPMRLPSVRTWTGWRAARRTGGRPGGPSCAHTSPT